MKVYVTSVLRLLSACKAYEQSLSICVQSSLDLGCLESWDALLFIDALFKVLYCSIVSLYDILCLQGNKSVMAKHTPSMAVVAHKEKGETKVVKPILPGPPESERVGSSSTALAFIDGGEGRRQGGHAGMLV